MSGRILIIEDEAALRKMLAAFLHEEGYACDLAGTLAEARSLIAKKAPYDLLLVDVLLPDGNGLSLIEEVNQSLTDTPKVIVSGQSEIETALRALRLGAYDFIQKPLFSMDRLGIVAQRAIERRRLILDRKENEAEIECMNAELARLNSALEEEVQRRTEDLMKANQALRTLDEMKNNLLANISHEMRTPLVSVRGYTELFASGQLCPIPQDCVKYLQTSLRNIDKLLALIDSLVRYAEMAREGGNLELEDTDLRAMLRESAERFAQEARKRGIEIEFNLPESPVPVRIDRQRVSDALDHMMQNAVKFNRDNGTVRLALDMVGARLVKVWVMDTGIGIPEGEQPRIFERFYQIDGSPTRTHGGTGMGLAIARDNLRLMGCELRVSSEPGRGSTFYFTIPTTEDTGSANASSALSPQE